MHQNFAAGAHAHGVPGMVPWKVLLRGSGCKRFMRPCPFPFPSISMVLCHCKCTAILKGVCSSSKQQLALDASSAHLGHLRLRRAGTVPVRGSVGLIASLPAASDEPIPPPLLHLGAEAAGFAYCRGLRIGDGHVAASFRGRGREALGNIKHRHTVAALVSRLRSWSSGAFQASCPGRTLLPSVPPQ